MIDEDEIKRKQLIFKKLDEKIKYEYNKPLYEYSIEELFYQAICGNLRLLNHPLIDIVKSKKEGLTILEILARYYKGFPAYKGIPYSWVIRKYPWYSLGRKKRITPNIVREILNTPKSVIFIKEIL